MYNTCLYCDTYVDQDEVECVDCAIKIDDELDLFDKEREKGDVKDVKHSLEYRTVSKS